MQQQSWCVGHTSQMASLALFSTTPCHPLPLPMPMVLGVCMIAGMLGRWSFWVIDKEWEKERQIEREWHGVFLAFGLLVCQVSFIYIKTRENMRVWYRRGAGPYFYNDTYKNIILYIVKLSPYVHEFVHKYISYLSLAHLIIEPILKVWTWLVF